jgi:hypothetical protein
MILRNLSFLSVEIIVSEIWRNAPTPSYFFFTLYSPFQRTTLILLCEDGSLRIYMANIDQTGYWLSPNLQPQSAISVLKPVKKKKAAKTGRPSGSVSFPIDFFEHAQQTNDIEVRECSKVPKFRKKTVFLKVQMTLSGHNAFTGVDTQFCRLLIGRVHIWKCRLAIDHLSTACFLVKMPLWYILSIPKCKNIFRSALKLHLMSLKLIVFQYNSIFKLPKLSKNLVNLIF